MVIAEAAKERVIGTTKAGSLEKNGNRACNALRLGDIELERVNFRNLFELRF